MLPDRNANFDADCPSQVIPDDKAVYMVRVRLNVSISLLALNQVTSADSIVRRQHELAAGCIHRSSWKLRGHAGLE